jgi:hypothetical protein
MRSGSALFFVAILLSSGSALGQTTGQRPAPPIAVEGWAPTTPQTQQTQKGVDPWQPYSPVTPGITAGQFTILPSVTAGAFYDDNVFASPSNRQGSWGGLVRPELGLRTAGTNYAVEARGYVERRRERSTSD